MEVQKGGLLGSVGSPRPLVRLVAQSCLLLACDPIHAVWRAWSLLTLPTQPIMPRDVSATSADRTDSSVHGNASLAICITGMYRTLDDNRVQRSLRALFRAFPAADIFTVIGVETVNETYKGGLVAPHTTADVESAFRQLTAPQQLVVHHHLSHREEMWARCNTTMVSQFHKWALCYQEVLKHRRSSGLKPYDWVLRTRNDLAWRPSLDNMLQLPAPRRDRVVITGRDTAASDWFILTPGMQIHHFLQLPNSPCEWGGSTRSWDMWFHYLWSQNFTRLMLHEGRQWPWPVEIIRSKSGQQLSDFCRAESRRSGRTCFDLTAAEVYSLMRHAANNGTDVPRLASRQNLLAESTFEVAARL